MLQFSATPRNQPGNKVAPSGDTLVSLLLSVVSVTGVADNDAADPGKL